jgi:hypothetical protein
MDVPPFRAAQIVGARFAFLKALNLQNLGTDATFPVVFDREEDMRKLPVCPHIFHIFKGETLLRPCFRPPPRSMFLPRRARFLWIFGYGSCML